MALFDDTRYESNSSVQEQQSKYLMELLSEILPKEADNRELNVLDAGCGTGEVTAELAQVLTNLGFEPRVLGIDKSSDQVSKARRLDNISFEQADVTNFSPSRRFDLIFSNAALHWIPNQKKLYKRLYELNSENGFLAVHQGGKGSYKELHEAAVKAFPTKTKPKPPKGYISKKEAEKLLKMSGYSQYQVEMKEYTMSTSETTIVDAFAEASLNTYTEQMDNQMKDRYKKKFSKIARKEYSEVTVRRIYLVAEK